MILGVVLHFDMIWDILVDTAASSSSRLSEEDLQAIADVCCSLMVRGRVQGVIRLQDDDDRIVCVSSEEEDVVGIGKNVRGRYYVFRGDGSAVVEGWRLQDVIKALAAS